MDIDRPTSTCQSIYWRKRRCEFKTSIFDEKQCQASDRQDPHSDSVVDVIFFSDSVADLIFFPVDKLETLSSVVELVDKLETLSIGFSSSSTVSSALISSVSCLQIQRVKKNKGDTDFENPKNEDNEDDADCSMSIPLGDGADDNDKDDVDDDDDDSGGDDADDNSDGGEIEIDIQNTN